MKSSEQTNQQIERFIRKVTEKFPANEDTSILTDIHVQASQDSGELIAFNDDDEEITRVVIDSWIDCKDENFYDEITTALRAQLIQMRDKVDNMGIMKPYSFVLEDDDKEPVGELYVVDEEDTAIIDKELMSGLDQELDTFLDNLMKE